MGRFDREKEIRLWMGRIERSRQSVPAFFESHEVPFGVTQYYAYRKKFQAGGIEALRDGRTLGNNRRIDVEAEGFLRGYVAGHPDVDLETLRTVLKDRFNIELTSSGLSRCLKRIGCSLNLQDRQKSTEVCYTACGGFELIVGLAYHLGWPNAVASLIKDRIDRCKDGKGILCGRSRDRRERTGGRFTAEYNRREDVRAGKFDSIDAKRRRKCLNGMGIAAANTAVLSRKCVATLALPVVTHNGHVRSVDTPQGNALRHICGFDYKQATLSKFLAELKYLGVADDLLRHQVGFWQERWSGRPEGPLQTPVLCYYVDGNTKALWSKKRVKKNKVTMLGRVMGCLEQVFVHDNFGRPLYFETYSGHAPVGEYVLSLFEKIEASLHGPGDALNVSRAIVMDGAGNSVRTLRAFAAQDKYHYITSLDSNQWDARKLRQIGRPQRYRYGNATLRDSEIELEDSREKDYLVVSRAIEVRWDYGRRTVLLTSLSADLVVASEVVKSYFDRWPEQELRFRTMKAVACLHRVAGYGKQKQANDNVIKRQVELSQNIKSLRARLAEPLVEIARKERRIDMLIRKERPLRKKSRIEKGKRILPKPDAQQLSAIGRQIRSCKRSVKVIERSEEKLFRRLRASEKEWFRLQGKETVYKADVELDQIMTFFRVALVNLYSYLAYELLGPSNIALHRLVQSVILLPARIMENADSRVVLLRQNDKEPQLMNRLHTGLDHINTLGFTTPGGKRLQFELVTET